MTDLEYDAWKTTPPDDDDIIAFQCDCCGRDVYVGDKYYIFDGEKLCDDCVEECECDYEDVRDNEYEPDWDSTPGGHDYYYDED